VVKHSLTVATRSRTLGLLPFLAIAVLSCRADAPPLASDAHRSLPLGEVVGVAIEDGAVHAWRGLPFAMPPVGVRRWRAPALAEPWAGVREARFSGSACAQLGGDPIMGSEDCLYLDVFAPARSAASLLADEDALPVMVWIHGGGNSMGAGDQLPPSALVRDGNVILVTINYRLGVFGWFAHPALRNGAVDSEDASGNFGTLDIIRALEWVGENIAAFGGDPGRVTIFGESAGGMNVFSLLVSPRAKGLFHAAISESGVPTAVTRAEAEHYTDDPVAPGLPGSSGELLVALLRQSGRAEDRAAAKQWLATQPPAEIERFLRGLETEEILQPFVEIMGDSGMPLYFSPNIFQDGQVVSLGEPIELLGTPGAYNAVPFIAGTNREETKLFLAMGSPHVRRRFGLPTGFVNERLYDLEGEYGGLMWRATGADEPVSAMRAVQGPSVWAYRFDWDEEPTVLGLDLSKLLGAAHGVEMLFVFGLTDLGWANRVVFEDPPSAERLSRQMRSYWTHFAHDHRPGRGRSGDEPEWAPWGLEAGSSKYLIFDSERDGGVRADRDRVDRHDVLERVSKDSRLLGDDERCQIYRGFAQSSDALSAEGYATIDGGICGAWPLESRLFLPALSHEN